MTRAQRIALAMRGYRPVARPIPVVYRIPSGPPRWINGRDAFAGIPSGPCCLLGCEDCLAPYQDVNPSDRHEHARVILGGNFGLPCA